MRVRQILRATTLACLFVGTAVTTVGAQDDARVPDEPVAFTATWVPVEVDELEGWGLQGIDPEHGINGQWQYDVQQTSDSRLDGTVSYLFNRDVYRANDLSLHHGTFRIENEAGAWQGSPGLQLGYPDLTTSTRTSALNGEGDYDGLTAVAELTYDRASATWQVRGYILDGAVPRLPGEGAFPE